jgi:hypothetical protein
VIAEVLPLLLIAIRPAQQKTPRAPEGPHPSPRAPINWPQGLAPGRQGESLLNHQLPSTVCPQSTGPQKRGSAKTQVAPNWKVPKWVHKP